MATLKVKLKNDPDFGVVTVETADYDEKLHTLVDGDLNAVEVIDEDEDELEPENSIFSQETAIQTAKVKLKNDPDFPPVVINRADFNPDIHVELDEEGNAIEDDEDDETEGGGSKVPGDPNEKLDFLVLVPFQGPRFKRFNVGDVYTATRKKGHEKAGSVWPVAQLNELLVLNEENPAEFAKAFPGWDIEVVKTAAAKFKPEVEPDTQK